MTPRLGWGVVVALGLSSGPALANDAGTPKATATPKAAATLVDATTVVPDLVVDLRYATADNFLKRKVYPDTARCLLLPESAERLKKAADVLRARGYRLKVYDCYGRARCSTRCGKSCRCPAMSPTRAPAPTTTGVGRWTSR